MKPGNLRKQGAKSGGSNRKMRELQFQRSVIGGALFRGPNRRKENGYAKENLYI